MGIGAVLGGVIGGYYTDKIGRYRMFLLDIVCLVLATIGAALAPNMYWLIFFRFLMGLGVGLDYPVAFSFIAEFVNARRKGGAISLSGLPLASRRRLLGPGGIGFLFSRRRHALWRYAIGFGALPALVVLLLRGKYMWESPLWVAASQGLGAAKAVIQKIYNVEVVLVPATPRDLGVSKISFAEIFRSPYLPRTIVVSIVSVTQSLEYFAVGFYLPSISQAIFGKEFIYTAVGTLVSTVAGVAGGLLAATLVDRVGARRLIAGGYSIIIISLIMFWYTAGAISPYWSILLVYLFIFGQTLGPGSLCASIAALSYPTRIRGTGTGWAQGMIRLGTVLGFYFFPVIMAQIGLNRMMLVLALVPLIGLASILSASWEAIALNADVEDELAPLGLLSAKEGSA